MPHSTHGTIVLMGSGETSASMVEVHKYAMSLVEGPVRAAFLDTPAGFQLNADLIAQKAVEFSSQRLNTPMEIASFKRASMVTPEELSVAVNTLRDATYIFAGPGSPSYAVNNWRNTPIADAMFDTLTRGGCLTFASAASLTLGRWTIPVYEIYKVGEQPRWMEGLNLLGHNDIDVAIVPHWNNNSGGDHDTNFCFIGKPRWDLLERFLPAETTVLGLDEHTACILLIDKGLCEVRGIGKITVRRSASGKNKREEMVFSAGENFSLDLLRPPSVVNSHNEQELTVPNHSVTWESLREQYGQLSTSDVPSADALTAYVYDLLKMLSDAREAEEWPTMRKAEEALREALVSVTARLDEPVTNTDEIIEPFVEMLLNIRRDLRAAKQWALADQIREGLVNAGLTIKDNGDGTVWHREP